MNFTEALLFIFTGTLGTIGFSLLFKMDWKFLPWATLCGTVACIVYVPVDNWMGSVFISNFIAAIVVTIYSEIFSRICRTPTTMFIIAGMIPFVPGSALYYTMSNLISGDSEMALSKFITTILVIVGLAFGVAAGSILVAIFKDIARSYSIRKMTRKAKKTQS